MFLAFLIQSASPFPQAPGPIQQPWNNRGQWQSQRFQPQPTWQPPAPIPTPAVLTNTPLPGSTGQWTPAPAQPVQPAAIPPPPPPPAVPPPVPAVPPPAVPAQPQPPPPQTPPTPPPTAQAASPPAVAPPPPPVDPVVRIQQSQSPPPPPSNNNDGCISLSASRQCPSFAGAYTIPSTFQYRGNITVNSIESFDLLISYLTREQDIAALKGPPYNCTNFSVETQPKFRTTIVCRQVLMEQNIAGVCPSRISKDVCKNTCLAHADDWDKRVTQPGICPIATKNPIRDLCSTKPFSGMGDTTDGCITGALNEKATCGFVFPQQKQIACDYCRTTQDPCCSSLPAELSACTFDATRTANNTASTSSSGQTSILPIVLFSLAALLVLILMCCVGVCLYKRRKKASASTDASGYSSDKPLPSSHSYTPYLQPSQPTAALNIGAPVAVSVPAARVPSPMRPPPQGPLPLQPVLLEKQPGQGNTHVAMFTYNPVLPDELELTVGDLVEVLQTYDDGWGVGRHINPKSNKTILEGAVPMVCLQRKHAWNVSDQQRPSIDRLRQSGDSYTLPSPPMPPPNQNASFYTAPERRTSLIMTNQVKTGVVRSGTVRMQTIDPQRHNANSYSTKQDFS